MINAHSKKLNIIVAVDQAGGYAKNNTIPWGLVPEDMEHFKKLTKDSVCIMGRSSFEEMYHMRLKRSGPKGVIKNILPDRESFVLSSDIHLEPLGATAATGITNAINKLPDGDMREVFILGGERLWVEALGKDAIVHMTIIKGDTYDCDLHFPLDILNREYMIVDGHETDLCYYVTYHKKPTVREETEDEKWNRFINENFRVVRNPNN